MTKGIRVLGFLALALIAAFVVLLSTTDTRASAPPFDPGGVICFENLDTPAECDGDTAAGAASDISSKFCVGWGGTCSTQPVTANVKDSNFGAITAMVPISFVPPEASNAPIGSIAGYLTADSVLGLLNQPCSSTVKPGFSLMIGSLNLSDTIDPYPVGKTNPGEPMALDTNNNGIPDGADKYPSYLKTFFNGLQPRARLFGVSKIQGGWVTLNFLFFDPGAHLTTSTGSVDITFKPELGLPSVTVLTDPSVPPSPGPISDFCAPLRSANVTLGKTFNNPCTPVLADNAAKKRGNCPLPEKGAANQSIQNSGYPFLPCESINALDEDADGKINDGCPQVNAVAESGAQCDNATSDDPEDSSVNDGCPQFGEVSEGSRIPGGCAGTDEGGCVVRKNPASGKHQFTIVAASQRDADSDGIENGLDVCSLIANADWNPRTGDTVNDTDQDGLPNPCDPQPGSKSGQSPLTCEAGIVGDDEDKDCFSNRADNCPTNNQLTKPNAEPSPDNLPVVADKDQDGIGDACDPDPEKVNGDFVGYCIQFGLEVGAPATPVTGVKLAEPAPSCAGASVSPPQAAPITPAPGAQTAAANQSSTTSGGVCTGAGCTASTGIGSLSPTNSGIPLWAVALAGVGALGLLAGGGLLRRSYVRRRIR